MRKNFTYCPKCGQNSLSFHENDKKMECGHCHFNFYFNVAFAVAAILEIEDRIVLTMRAHDPAKGKFDLPGGFVDKNETAEDAIIREVKEELNATIVRPSYLCSYPNVYLYRNVSYHTLDMVFHYRFRENPNFSASDDVSDFLIVKTDEIPYSQIAFSSLKKALRIFTESKVSQI